MTRRGEIYMISLAPGVGHEVYGERPALVIQNDGGNEFSSTTIVAFMTTNDRGYDFYVPMRGDLKLPGRSFVMLDQVRTVAMERLGRLVGKADALTMKRVEEALHLSLGLTSCRS